MAELLFFEKPGCASSLKQKRLLREAGVSLQVKDLLSERWSPAKLRPFFSGLRLQDCLNPNAPRIKCGDFVGSEHSEEEILAAMCADPLLIRRPLLQLGDWRGCGFNPEQLSLQLGVQLKVETDLERCSHEAQT